MITKIQRHLFKRLLKSFFLFLLLVVFSYTLIDFSTKVSDFSDTHSINYLFMLKFYGCEFCKRAHILVPLCFSLSVLLQVLHLLKTKELIALLSAGITYRRVLLPFWTLGLGLSTLLFLNRHYLIPPTRLFIESYRNDHVRIAKKPHNSDEGINTLILKDDSRLIYQSYDPIKKEYFDLFWIISPQRILRIKYLESHPNGFKARFVDELTRNQMGTLQKKHSFKELMLSKEWLKGARFDRNLPIQSQNLSQMFKGLSIKDYIYSKDAIFSEVILVTIMSLSPLWLLMMQSPILSRYTREIPVLFYVGSHLLFFFCISTIFDGLGIITQRSIVSPWILLVIPALIGLAFLIRRYRTSLR
jgi:hypothetical protein